jgi:hypothetical protein
MVCFGSLIHFVPTAVRVATRLTMSLVFITKP